jgi:hypothetical protein
VFSRDELKPYPANGSVECWAIAADSQDGDFWRADPRGLLFLTRRLEEDLVGKIAAGTVLDAELPCWRTAECLLHAGWMARTLGASEIDVEACWHGLAGRHLDHVNPETRFRYPPVRDHKCRIDRVENAICVSAATCDPNLTDIVLELTRPLYEAFDFYEMPREIADNEIKAMRR